MDVQVATHPIVDQTKIALGMLAGAAPVAALATEAAAEVDAAWSTTPFVIGLVGAPEARTALLNHLCGGPWIEPKRTAGAALIRIRRGAATRFRALRDDGSAEEHAQPAAPRGDTTLVRTKANAARHELAAHEGTIAQIDRIVPALARTRPTGLRVLLWPIYWLLAWVYRRRLEARRVAVAAVRSARGELDSVDDEVGGAAKSARVARDRYLASLRALSSGGATATGVREIDLELANGPLPEGVEVIELADGARSSVRVDGIVMVDRDRLHGPGDVPVAIGGVAEVVDRLGAVAADARALVLGHQFRTRIASAIEFLDDTLARKEAGYAARLEALERRRLTDPTKFAAAQLASVAQQITASVHAVIEHASAHLGSELAELQHQWISGIAGATTADELKPKVAKVIDQWGAEPRRIGDEVRTLVMGGLGGCTRELYGELVTPLIELGLPAPHHVLRAAPVLPPVTVLPSLFTEGAKLELPGLLTKLFRSFDSRRAEVREKVHERLEQLQVVTAAEMLDAEPQFCAVLTEVLEGLLTTAIKHQGAWLDGALAVEQEAIERDRATIAPLVEIRDTTIDAAAKLAELVAAHERTHPAIAAAALAAEAAAPS